MVDPLPRISIVTPSYNQAQFLPETIASVFSQNYPNLEYVIIDGGSTDGSQEIVRSFDKSLAYWVSEPDQGQYDAINKGFSHTSGEIMAWINSDDKYTPWALRVVAEIFLRFPHVHWLTTLYPLAWDERGLAVECYPRQGYSRASFFRGEYLPGAVAGWHTTGSIQQESTFWRRSLWDQAGGTVDKSLQLAGDFELWARFYKLAELYGIGTPLGGFRRQKNQKTVLYMEKYARECEEVLRLHGGRPYGKLETMIRSRFFRFIPKPVKRKLRLERLIKVCLHIPNEGWRIVDSRDVLFMNQ